MEKLDLIRDSERAHYIMQLGSYFTELTDRSGVRFAYTQHLTDVWYNQAYGIDPKCDRIDVVLETIEQYHRQRDRIPCVYVSPAAPPGLEPALGDAGYEIFEREAWMFFPELGGRQHINNSEITVRRVESQDDVDDFRKVYRLGLPGPEVESYLDACLEGRRYQPPLVQVDFFLADLADRPIGMLTLVTTGVYAGIYAVATLPEFRRLGAAAALNRVAVKTAHERGCHHVYLQTVEGELAETVFRQLGYAPLFTRVGYTPKEAVEKLTHG